MFHLFFSVLMALKTLVPTTTVKHAIRRKDLLLGHVLVIALLWQQTNIVDSKAYVTARRCLSKKKQTFIRMKPVFHGQCSDRYRLIITCVMQIRG